VGFSKPGVGIIFRKRAILLYCEANMTGEVLQNADTALFFCWLHEGSR